MQFAESVSCKCYLISPSVLCVRGAWFTEMISWMILPNFLNKNLVMQLNILEDSKRGSQTFLRHCLSTCTLQNPVFLKFIYIGHYHKHVSKAFTEPFIYMSYTTLHHCITISTLLCLWQIYVLRAQRWLIFFLSHQPPLNLRYGKW